MNTSATKIQAMVRNMDHSKKRWRHLKTRNPEEFLGHMRTENQELFNDFPAIFALHADDKLDETFFFMLQQKRKIEKGDITEDQAAAVVGQKLFDRWVAPVLSPGNAAPRALSYEEYYKQQQDSSQQ